MTEVTFVAADGKRTTVDATDGDSVMQTAVDNLIEGIVGECGGSMMCASCHVYVPDAFADKLPPVSDGEAEMLECTAAERRDNSRLSCQVIVGPELAGIEILMPDTQF